MLIQIHTETPGKKRLLLGVEALQKGELIIYPTDTLYGLGCDIYNKSAIEKIYKLKKMDKRKPLSIICSDFPQIAEYAHISNYAFKIVKRLLPGPYTIILPATNKVPKILISKQRTIGIRIPDSNFSRELVRELGNPIVTTTLESDIEMDISDPEVIHERYQNQVKYVYSDGISYAKMSTVIDLTGPEMVLVRSGQGDLEADLNP